MQLFRPLEKRQPPPLWFVSNGETTVGPVRTDLLLRGVFHGRVPHDCWVRELRWEGWRELYRIREIAALRRVQVLGGTVGDALVTPGEKASRLVAHARDAGEVLLFSLHAAVAATGAELGLVHRMNDPWARPMTRVAHGPGTHGSLGSYVAATDLALGAARARRIVIGAPDATAVHRSIAGRLTGGLRMLRGVAMFPVCRDRELVAFIEIGRADHPFRTADLDALETIGRRAIDRIERAPS